MHTHVHTRCICARTRMAKRIYASCARVCTQIFTKLFLAHLYSLMCLSLKFYKDPSFGCGDIHKTIRMFVSSLYFYVFCIQHLSIKVPTPCENYLKLVGPFGNYISKCSGISENMAPTLAHMVLLNRSYSKILLKHSLWNTLYFLNLNGCTIQWVTKKQIHLWII